MEKIDTSKNTNLRDYVLSNYVKYFDLTPGREMELAYLLGNCNASLIDVEQFREVFDLQGTGFFGVLKYLADVNNLEKLSQYGAMCLSDYTSQMESMRKNQGISL
ncbi:MAG: hypothetical protein K2H20_03380 [Bacilli bacterium]|nr:hypothetical protein [Bacilli bacterium]